MTSVPVSAVNEPSRARRVGVAAAAILLAAVAARFTSDSSWQAPARLMLAILVCAFMPGYGVMRVLGWFSNAEGARERIPLAFGIGYALVTVACAFSVRLELSLAQAVGGIAALGLLLAALPSRTGSQSRASSKSIAFVIAVAATCGWFLEPLVEGEETVEVISIRMGWLGPSDRTRPTSPN